MKIALGLLALALLGAVIWIVLALISWQERRPRAGLLWVGLGVAICTGLGAWLLAQGPV